ncbi:MAG: GNAT family N-acetyltransferase [Lactobacillaceae bacterium]|jgi:RimJ/RimL family protein N-acetyltransferase|nr:GNAT family N-acetyltransferase [Lactobacillaceae bacterium]
MTIEIRKFTEADLEAFWQLAFSDSDAEWTKWDAPYFTDALPEYADFIDRMGPETFVDNEMRQLIIVDGQLVGMVSAYFEDADLKRWLEIGIIIYQQSTWQHGIGTAAIKMWIKQMFNQFPSLPHIGFTTWSGNQRMMRVGEKVGMQLEGRIRQVRYWQGQYWDSIKYGILREEADLQ